MRVYRGICILLLVLVHVYVWPISRTERVIKSFNAEKPTEVIAWLQDPSLEYDTATTVHLNSQHYNSSLKKILSLSYVDTIIVDNALMIGVEDFLYIAENEWISNENYENAAQFYNMALHLSQYMSNYKYRIKIKALRRASDFCFDVNNYSAVVDLLNDALELCKLYCPDSAQIIYTLNSLGTAYNYVGQREDAEKCFLSALAARKKLQVLYDDDHILNIVDLINLYRDTEQYDLMAKYIIELYCSYENGYNGNEGIFFPSYYKLLVKRHQEQTDDFFLTTMSDMQVSDYTRFLLLDNLGQFYHEYLFDFSKAEKYYLQAQKIDIANKDLRAAISTDLGSLYKDAGYYEKAEPLLLLARKDLLESSDLYLPSSANLGDLYWKMGNREKALEYFLFVNKFAHNFDAGTRDKLKCKIGDIYTTIGKFNEARTFYQAVLDSFRITLTDHGLLWRSEAAWAKKGIAMINFMEGDTLGMVSAFEDLVKTENMYDFKNNKDLMYAYSWLGFAYTLNRNYVAAEGAYNKSLELCAISMGKDNLDYADDLLDLGIIHNELGQNGIDEVSTAFKSYHDKYVVLSSFASAQQRDNFWATLEGTFERKYPRYFYRAWQNGFGINSLAYDVLLYQKGILLSTTQLITASILSSGDSALITDFKDYQSLNEKIYKLQELNVPQSIIDSIADIAESKEKILINRSAMYRREAAIWNITWDSVRNHLQDHQTAIEYMVAPLNDDSIMYCALLLQKNCQAPLMIPLFNESEVASIVNTTTENHTNFTYSYVGNGEQISKLVWSKILPFIKKGETVYFAPSGLLHQLAIESLPYDENHTMADMFNLVRLSSTREIVTLEHDTGHTTATLYGGIQYDVDADKLLAESEKYSDSDLLASRGIGSGTMDRGSIEYLKGSKVEVENINSMLKQNNLQVQLFTSTNANEESFKSLNGKHQNILHIATHGFFWSDSTAQKKDYFSQRMLSFGNDIPTPPAIDPMNRCGLLFAGAQTAWSGHSTDLPEGVQDGILTAKEISLLDLRDAGLVVLSACETGKGEITGDGVFGLQRAFKQAGAQTIIMSLWPVNDAATQLLMTEFYRNWISLHQDKREAFRNAQNSVRLRFEEPIYWAGFIMLD